MFSYSCTYIHNSTMAFYILLIYSYECVNYTKNKQVPDICMYRMQSRGSAHSNSRSLMNNNLVADKETFQRRNLNNLKDIVASKFKNISMLDIFNQVNNFIELTMS